MNEKLSSLPPEIQEKLNEAVKIIVEIANPQLVILFGSYATGCQTEESDLDLLVVADTTKRHELYVQLRRTLRPILDPLRFDLIVYQTSDWEYARHLRGFVTRDADRKGVRLFEAA